MWRVDEVKVIVLTWGGLVGFLLEVVTTNDEKSAEAIVGASRRAEQSTQAKNRKVFHATKPESGGNSP
jgi:hypothetical protein